MNTWLKWLIGTLVALTVAGGLIFAFIEGRNELTREREREAPVKTPTRTYRNEQGETVITLNAETRARIAIDVAPLIAEMRTPDSKAFGVVLDPAPIVTMYSELAAAEAALANSNAQLARAKTLFEEDQNVSKRALETAEAQQRTDTAKLINAQQRWTLELGDATAKLGPIERDRFIANLLQRKIALARVEIPPGESIVTPREARVTVSGAEETFVTVRAIYAAPSVDRQTLGQAFLLLLESSNAQLLPGAAITAYLSVPSEKQNGVLLPASSVVRAAGLAWAYVQSGDDDFIRRQVSTSAPTANGWFVDTGFNENERIVVTGAQTLLSEEFKSQISVGEEGEKD